MNLQMALGQKRYLLLHAATVEKDGRALIMTGESGAGKSTLAALLGERGWRLMGDEFALLDMDERRAAALPARDQPQERRDRGDGGRGRRRPASARVSPARPRATSATCAPIAEALARMGEGARPALILFPRFGEAGGGARRRRGRGVHAPDPGLDQLCRARPPRLRRAEPADRRPCPALAIDYPDTDTAIGLVDDFRRELAA